MEFVDNVGTTVISYLPFSQKSHPGLRTIHSSLRSVREQFCCSKSCGIMPQRNECTCVGAVKVVSMCTW